MVIYNLCKNLLCIYYNDNRTSIYQKVIAYIPILLANFKGIRQDMAIASLRWSQLAQRIVNGSWVMSSNPPGTVQVLCDKLVEVESLVSGWPFVWKSW